MEESLLVSALKESIELLRETVAQQRAVNGLLRRINTGLRRQLAVAHQNDEAFRAECVFELDEHETVPGALPDTDSSQA